MASTGAGRGAAVPPGAPTRPMSLQQQQEFLRRTKKCVSCGNTAMGKCDFRACGTCCARNKNPCQGHGARQGVVAPGPIPETPVRPQYQWPANPPMGVMGYNMRPPNGHATSPFVSSGPMMGYRMPFTSPVARMPAPPPPETDAQKEARLEKMKKTLLINQKETATINSLRVVKMKHYADAELSFEDEAFDRYMLNAMLLEEAAGLDDASAPESLSELNEEDLTNAMLAKYEFKNKEAQRQKLQKVVTKSLQRARKREGEELVEIREYNQVGYGRKDTKRMKVQTVEGKEYLRRINAWEDLFQEIGSFSKMGDVSLFLDTYKDLFGQDLGHSLPQLIKRDTSQRTDPAVSKPSEPTETRQSDQQRAKEQRAVVEVGKDEAAKDSHKEQVPVHLGNDAAPSTVVPKTGTEEQVQGNEHAAALATKQIPDGGENADIPVPAPAPGTEDQAPGISDQSSGEPGDKSLASEQAGPSTATVSEVLTMEQLFAISAQAPVEDAEQQYLMTEMLHELAGSVEQQTMTGPVSAEQQALAAQMLEELGVGKQEQQGVSGAMEPGEQRAHEMTTTIQPVGTVALGEQSVSAVEFGTQVELAEQAVTVEQNGHVGDGLTEQLEQPAMVEPMEVDNDQNAEAAVSNVEEVIDEKWLENVPRLPVRRVVTSLIKQKPDTAGISCVKVDLEEHSFQRVFCNQNSYSFESL